MGKFSFDEIESQYNLIKMLLAEPKKSIEMTLVQQRKMLLK